jgi:CRP/FNR family cyclic AMP-dependent transcriptional regulator
MPSPGETLTVNPEVISLLDADPDLAEGIDPDDRELAARHATTRVTRLTAGEWDATTAIEADIHHRGFLVVDGLLSREVEVMGRGCVELVGHGDIVRPWSWDDVGSHVPAELAWTVLEPTRLAVLDHALVTRVAPWPSIGVELFSRGLRRAHHLAVALAITNHQRVDERLRLTLWHLAERWGRVTPEGVVVPLPLGHQRLANIVGANRSTVTSALGELTRDGGLSRRESGEWVLHGSPPREIVGHALAELLT